MAGQPQVLQAAALRMATLLSPAIARLEQLIRQTDNPSVALAAIKEVLERNGLEAFAKPISQVYGSNLQPLQQAAFDVSRIKFEQLSDAGLDAVDRVAQGLLRVLRSRRRASVAWSST
jgi:hypothetical protein